MRCRFWVKAALQLFGSILLGVAVFSLMTQIQFDDVTLRGAFSQAAGFIMSFGAMVQVLFYMGVYRLSAPLVISFGSTRKETFWGIQLLRLILMVLCIGTYCLLAYLAGDPIRLGFAVGIFLIGGSLGSVLGILTSKFGKIVSIITMIVFVICCGLIGAASVIYSAASGFSLPWLSWVLPLAGIAVYLAVMIPEWKTIGRLVVKL